LEGLVLHLLDGLAGVLDPGPAGVPAAYTPLDRDVDVRFPFAALLICTTQLSTCVQIQACAGPDLTSIGPLYGSSGEMSGLDHIVDCFFKFLCSSTSFLCQRPVCSCQHGKACAEPSSIPWVSCGGCSFFGLGIDLLCRLLLLVLCLLLLLRLLPVRWTTILHNMPGLGIVSSM
jgi:hypothetical protein